MFQKILFKLTSFLGKLYGKFNVAFNETYSDKKIGKCAIDEIEKRKEENKEKFVSSIALLTMLHAYSQDKEIINPELARKYAEYLFDKEVKKGNIDELNNLKESEDE